MKIHEADDSVVKSHVVGQERRLIEEPQPLYKWVYLWHWPLRAMHWVSAASVFVLIVTGFFIGRPYFMTGGEATPRFIMGQMRFLHFAAAGVLVATAIIRVYWLFMGNRFESWRALFPVLPKDWRNMVRRFWCYLVIEPEKAPQYVGHNPLQQFSYTGLYLLAALQVFTGFYLYGQADPNGFFYGAFGWVGGLMGGAQMVRFVHHICTWLFLAFIPVHIYFTIRADIIAERGTVSAMISGVRFVRTDFEYEDD